MIQDIIFRVIPSLLFFVILTLLSYILLVYLCLSVAVPHLSKGQSITLQTCTVDRPPSSRHTLLYGASLSSVFPCPIASYILPVRLLSLSVCLFPSVFLLFYYRG